MSENLRDLLVTVISGVLVFVICQLFTEFILRPVQDYKKLKAKVAKLLVLHAAFYANPRTPEDSGDDTAWRKASADIRELAAEVTAFAETKPLQIFILGGVPGKKKLKEASRYLIGLSNSFFVSKKEEDRGINRGIDYPLIIKKDLRIKDYL